MFHLPLVFKKIVTILQKDWRTGEISQISTRLKQKRQNINHREHRGEKEFRITKTPNNGTDKKERAQRKTKKIFIRE